MWNWIELEKSALQHNVRIFKDLLGAQRAAFVVKANAYGHGLKQIYEAIESENPEWLCVNYVAEAQLLRGWGYKGRLLVVGPFVPDDMDAAAKAGIELFLGHQEGLTAWLKSKLKPKLHIEFDTGMSRQGFLPKDAQGLAETLLPHKDYITGICMHFANVEDVTEHSYADTQLERFEHARKEFSKRGYKALVHASSSASALLLESSRFDLCRVGISLYGLWPSQATKISYAQLHGKDVIDLWPVLSWRTQITSLNEVSAGQYIGYGCTFKARHDMRVAVLPVGYYEGYPRSTSGSPTYVLIHGERCPLVGRICMNMLMVDVSDLKSIKVGDTATLIGTDGHETIAVSDLATWAQTIHYELVTRLNPEIPRKLI